MKKILVFIFSLIALVNILFAQDTIDTTAGEISVPLQKSDSLFFYSNLDSIMHLWYVKHAEAVRYRPKYAEKDTSVPTFPDSVYMDRIAKLNSVIDLAYNSKVRAFIEMYTSKKREQVETMLGLSQYYFPIFEQILDYNNVPLELKNLAIIESALNPRAVSRAKAVGLWQFMYSTGKMYGLNSTSFVDERRDPIKSTHAAASFLNDLYEMFGDWVLALAAYNCGPGNVKKAIRRSGGKTDYWEIYNYLPRETRGYVPAFIAANYVMTYHEEHNLYPKPINLPYPIDTIIVTEKLHLMQVSEVLKINFELLQDLNPQYRLDIIPYSEDGYALIMPAEYSSAFIDLQDSIFAYNDSIYFNPENLVKAPPVYESKNYTQAPPGNGEKVYYTVKSGDNLGYIANWYNVRLSDLSYWNNIHRNLIRVGQKLVIYVPKDKVDYYRRIDTMSFAEKQGGKSSSSIKTPGEPVKYSGEYLIYTVKSGDSLWAISRQYGVSEDQLMKINGITNPRSLALGQQLKIPKK